jgi:hypothetical protein
VHNLESFHVASLSVLYFLQFLIEKVIRSRIWESNYWKEHCFALTAVTIIDRAASLRYVGGTFGGHNLEATAATTGQGDRFGVFASGGLQVRRP